MPVMKSKGPRPRHVPRRTCIACRTTGAKRGLVRIVRTTDGRAEIDETGKKPGRGAYLCRASDCWETALKRKTLEYALKIPVSMEDRASLQAYAANLRARTEEEKLEELGVANGEPQASD